MFQESQRWRRPKARWCCGMCFRCCSLALLIGCLDLARVPNHSRCARFSSPAGRVCRVKVHVSANGCNRSRWVHSVAYLLGGCTVSLHIIFPPWWSLTLINRRADPWLKNMGLYFLRSKIASLDCFFPLLPAQYICELTENTSSFGSAWNNRCSNGAFAAVFL